MTVRVFVDESKARGYLLAAATVRVEFLDEVRKPLLKLRLPGQKRIHYNDESDRRRRQIVSVICRTRVPVTIYDASAISDQKLARTACLEALVADMTTNGAYRVVLEQDASVVAQDRQVLFTQAVKAGVIGKLDYEHELPHKESLLWIPDAVAWCWAKRGEWRRRVQPVVEAVRVVR